MKIFFTLCLSEGFCPAICIFLIDHDARNAPSSGSENVSEISSSDMHIHSLQVLIKIFTAFSIKNY